MTTETMTIHKALSELKILDSRIHEEIRAGIYCAVKKKSEKLINGRPVDDVKTDITAQFNKVSDLIRRRKAIKKAVVLSNAKTEVEIDGNTYTVAEAIEMKNHGVEFEKKLISQMRSRYTNVQVIATNENGTLSDRADRYVASLYGQKDIKNISSEAEETRKKFIESNTCEIVDPIDIKKVGDAMEDKIHGFMSEVDSALSCSNALTVIEVEY